MAGATTRTFMREGLLAGRNANAKCTSTACQKSHNVVTTAPPVLAPAEQALPERAGRLVPALCGHGFPQLAAEPGALVHHRVPRISTFLAALIRTVTHVIERAGHSSYASWRDFVETRPSDGRGRLREQRGHVHSQSRHRGRGEKAVPHDAAFPIAGQHRN